MGPINPYFGAIPDPRYETGIPGTEYGKVCKDIQDDKLVASAAIKDADGNIYGMKEKVIMSKEDFLTCFREWVTKEELLKILNEKGEDTDAQ